MTARYFEGFSAGPQFGSGRIRVERKRIKSFASEFGPPPFHRGENVALASVFRGLATSGWYTAALTMRLLVESDLGPGGGIVGAGFDDFRQTLPVRPGDALRLMIEVLETGTSKSRLKQGVSNVQITALNQNNDPVQVFLGNPVRALPPYNL